MHCSPLGSRYEIPDTQMADEKQLEILQDKANFRSFKPKPFNMRRFMTAQGARWQHPRHAAFLPFRGEVCSAECFKVVSESPGWQGVSQPGPLRKRGD